MKKSFVSASNDPVLGSLVYIFRSAPNFIFVNVDVAQTGICASSPMRTTEKHL